MPLTPLQVQRGNWLTVSRYIYIMFLMFYDKLSTFLSNTIFNTY